MIDDKSIYTAIGLMSGTSCDGIDVALIETDGKDIVRPRAFLGIDYTPEQRAQIKSCYGLKAETPDWRIKKTERMLTLLHADAVASFLAAVDMSPAEISCVGFHGQTIFHDPANRFTWQIGDGALLARETGIDVVYDFRTRDVAAGGQGAPLVPVYHRALAAKMDKPVMFLNIGGVANITYIGKNTDELIAFDTGPGGALMDDLMLKRTGKPYDRNGETAAKGTVQKGVLDTLLSHQYFRKAAPKSLDRDAFDTSMLDNLSLEDAMATLCAFTVESIALSLNHVPQAPALWLVHGGGRNNDFLMSSLRIRLGVPVKQIDENGRNGDALEAEAFAYMAVRSIKGLPISFPGTTGCPEPMTGGTFVKK